MPAKTNILVLSALFCISASAPASAQTVYKCASRGSVTYTEKPCSNRTVATDQAPVPAEANPKEVDVRRMNQNRALARSMRQLPGETAEEFGTRRRRARLMPEDRDECARLDTRMPVEAASLSNPDKEEAAKAEAALAESKKRFRKLRC